MQGLGTGFTPAGAATFSRLIGHFILDEIQKKLLNKAGRILARRAYSRGEMEIKLARIASDDEVEEALRRLEELDLLNDAKYAYNFALCRIKQDRWGPIRVQHALLRSRVAPETADAAIARVRLEIGDDVALAGYLDQLRRKHELPSDRKGIRKLILHLRRRGFKEETIHTALERVISPAAWECFETGE